MASCPMPESPPSKPHSILKDTSQNEADNYLARYSDKPRVAFAASEEPNPTGQRQQQQQQQQQRPENPPVKKKANLIIRPEEETRVVLALQKASKKQATGSIFSVVVDISKNGTLDIGVKDLPENLLVVSLLKRGNGHLGAAEEAGIRLGDVIFGINFIPTREGSKTLITVIKLETEKKKRFLHIQAWRCHQLCSDEIPGYTFPRADDLYIRGYDLFQNKVFSDWERWNFVEIILGYMVEDLHIRALSSDTQSSDNNRTVTFAQTGRVRARQMQSLDLEKNILQAKGLRSAISVRIVHTKTKEDVVTYILRVEDVESGLVWIVTRRYNEFYALHEELNEASHFLKDLEFPRKRLTLRLSARVIEQRVTMLEQYIRRALHTLTLNACIEYSASHGLRRVQHFLAVEKHVDCIHPPLVDDQRAIELLAYRFLNDFNSPACQQCVRFTSSVELEGMIESGEDGYRGLLTFMHDALAEVEQFVQQQHEQQLMATLKSRRPEWTEEQKLNLVRQCIRRQVEAALYLPLRRPLVRLLLNALDVKSKKLQQSISLLQLAKPSVFMIDPMVTKTKSFPKAIKAFRRALLAHLPADQGQFLVEAAMTISEVHAECKEMQRTSRRLSLSPKGGAGKVDLDTWQQMQQQQHVQNGQFVTSQKSLSSIRDDARTVSIDDPTWAYDSEDAKQRGSFGRSHNSSRSSNGNTSHSSSRRSITERLGFNHFLTTESVSAPASFSARSSMGSSNRSSLGGGSECRTSISQQNLTQHDCDDDELEMGLGEEPQRVSFSVGQATSAMMMLNIQSPDESSVGHNHTPSSTAQKICSYVPKREQATGMLEKRALSKENQQQTQFFANPSQNNSTEVSKDLFASQSSRTEIPTSDEKVHNNSSSKNKDNLDKVSLPEIMKLESVIGASTITTEVNCEVSTPVPPPPALPPRPDNLFPPSTQNITLVRPPSASSLFGSDNDIVGVTSEKSHLGDNQKISDNDPLLFSDTTYSSSPARSAAHCNNRSSISFSSDTVTNANSNNNSNNIGANYSSSSSNRLSTRQLDRTSSRKADIIDPLLRPPDEPQQQQRRGSSNVVDSTIFAEVFDRYRNTYDNLETASLDSDEEDSGVNAISADDFLPIFTYIVVHVQVPQMLLLKELMVALIANEDAFGECGYYLATFEAALQHVNDMASQYDNVGRNDSLVSDRQLSSSVH